VFGRSLPLPVLILPLIVYDIPTDLQNKKGVASCQCNALTQKWSLGKLSADVSLPDSSLIVRGFDALIAATAEVFSNFFAAVEILSAQASPPASKFSSATAVTRS
jgi:hypothetical protein